MGKTTEISWCDSTFNPWIGCTKVSPGCKNCYAETLMDSRYGRVKWGKGQPRQRTSKANWKLPVKWNQFAAEGQCLKCGQLYAGPAWDRIDKEGFIQCDECNATVAYRRARIFCASLSDWLDDEVPIEWLADLLKLIHETPNCDWLLLTKRPEHWRSRIGQANDSLEPGCPTRIMLSRWVGSEALKLEPTSPANVWLGSSVEDQQRADERIPALLQIPARIRFLSVEPMLERIDFSSWQPLAIHQMIFGGESGRDARHCHVDWIRDGLAQCRTAGVASFVKQLGANVAGNEMDKWVTRIKDKKGADMNEWPQELRVREFPK